MACCNPFLNINKNAHLTHTDAFGVIWTNYQYYYPCGWCLNCRVDKRNQYSDRCKYELKQKNCGAFVTLTYDERSLYPHLVKQYDGSVLPTLCYSDVQKYLKKIRAYMDYHNINYPMCRRDFTYLVVGEYGEGSSIPRPHWHILFFGLDFAFCRKMFRELWNHSIVDSLPILQGGINYVLKYMDKQVFGDLAKEKYDEKNLERPKQRLSNGLGANLYYDNIDDIVDNEFTYNCGRGLRRPVPQYYKNKFFGSESLKIKRDANNKKLNSLKSACKQYRHTNKSLKDLEEFSKNLANRKEARLLAISMRNGDSVLSPLQGALIDPERMKEIYKLDKPSVISIQSLSRMALEYINNIQIGGNAV